jgi:hypothetical protein
MLREYQQRPVASSETQSVVRFELLNFRLVLPKEISSRLHAPGRFGMQRNLELMFASWPTIPTRKPETSKLI